MSMDLLRRLAELERRIEELETPEFKDTDMNSYSAFGEQLVAQLDQKINVRFDTGINTRQVNTTTNGSATITESNSKAVLSTGTTTGSDATLTTRRVLKYNNGMGILARFTTIYTTGVVNTLQIMGVGDQTDGLFFGYDGADFGVFRYQNGTKNFISQSSWNVDTMDGNGPSGQTLDQTDGNVYQIKFQHLGFGQITFAIEDANRGAFVDVHRIQYANANTNPHVFNPSFPISMIADNDTTTTDITMETASVGGFLEGFEQFIGPRNAIDGSASSVNSEQNVIAIRNKATAYAGSVTNRAPIIVDWISVANDGPKQLKVKLYLDMSISGASYTDIDTNYSPVDYTTTNGALSGGNFLIPIELGTVGSITKSLEGLRIILYPDEQLVVTAQTTSGGSGNDVVIGLSWRELL